VTDIPLGEWASMGRGMFIFIFKVRPSTFGQFVAGSKPLTLLGYCWATVSSSRFFVFVFRTRFRFRAREKRAFSSTNYERSTPDVSFVGEFQ